MEEKVAYQMTALHSAKIVHIFLNKQIIPLIVESMFFKLTGRLPAVKMTDCLYFLLS